MDTLKEIAQGVLVIALIGALVVGVFAVAVNVTQPEGGTAPTENIHSGSDDGPELSFWVHHDLDAIPGLENATPSDLPTAEKVENILFEWDVFENARPPYLVNFTTKSFEDVFDIVKWAGLEYHFDENGRLHVDTPGWIYETPNERNDSEYWIANSTMEEGGGGSRNALDFCRHLKKQGIANGIAISEAEGYYPYATAVVPVKSGLMYSGRHGNEYLINRKPGRNDSWLENDAPVRSIDLYWRLGEGDYVQWNYILENGETTMVWPENAQPVGWEIRTS